MNLLDRFICYFAPAAGARRLHARATLQQINQLMGAGVGPYDAAKLNRLGVKRFTYLKENEVSHAQVNNLRAESWRLYRNNHSARKIVRSLEAKVIGKKGMNPKPMTTREDGTAFVEFRERAKQLWDGLKSGFDARGLPGRGGLTMAGLQKLALRSVVLSGDVLTRFRPVTADVKESRGLPIPLTLQLIDSCRLADDAEVGEVPNGNTVFRGIELNADGERVAYHIRMLPAYAGANMTANAKRFSVSEIGHVYVEEDIDQLRGTPWFSAAIIGVNDTSDLQYNVLKASAMAACLVGTYSKPTGAARFGLNASPTVNATSADGSDLTDANGNTITKLQPGMLINTGKDGAFNLLSPSQPNMNPEGFVQHMQRGTATAIPGIKASTITGDYRNSSFSSERSADNDTWPEIHDVQEWFSATFCQPIYETVIRAGILAGYFDGIVTPAEFQSDTSRFCAAEWQGPVALSINPVDDAAAAGSRIQKGISSLQMECAKVNIDWRDVLNDASEVYAAAKDKDIPVEFVNNIFGVDSSDVVSSEQATQAPDQQQNQQQEAVTNGA